MAITIVDNGGSLKITNGAEKRNVMKAQIIEVIVIKNNIIKIDIGGGPLHNIFLPYIDVTAPSTASADELRDTIALMAEPDNSGGGGVGLATEQRQIDEIAAVSGVTSAVSLLQLAFEDAQLFKEPVRTDDNGAGVIYEGYSTANSPSPAAAVWAIKRTKHEADGDVVTWVNGNKEFLNIWNNREALVYS